MLHTTTTPKDGNCMFHAYARALVGRATAAELRRIVVEQVAREPDRWSPFISDNQPGQPDTTPISRYLKNMAKDGEWGDHICLTVLGEHFDADVHVVKVKNSGRLGVNSVVNRGLARHVFWLYLENDHYENLVDASQVKDM